MLFRSTGVRTWGTARHCLVTGTQTTETFKRASCNAYQLSISISAMPQYSRLEEKLTSAPKAVTRRSDEFEPKYHYCRCPGRNGLLYSGWDLQERRRAKYNYGYSRNPHSTAVQYVSSSILVLRCESAMGTIGVLAKIMQWRGMRAL